MVRRERIELEPFCGGERSGSPQAKSRAERGIWGIVRCERETGAPGENRTPNLMVRSHALYPIELRAHCAEIASLNYNGNRSVSPNPIDGRARRKTLSRGLLRLRFAPNPALAVEIGGPAENGRFASQSKSFRPSAKPTAPAFLPMHVGNALAMAADML